MKKLFVLLIFVLSLTTTMLCCSCSSETEENPYLPHVLYQADNYTSNYIYSLSIGHYSDVGAPEFMGIPLAMEYEEKYLLLLPDLFMKYEKKPFDSVDGKLLENITSTDTKTELIQQIQQTDQTLLEGLDQNSILVNYACRSENGTALIFTDTLHNSFIYIAEFDVDGVLLRLVEVQQLRNTMISKYAVSVS